MQIHRAVAFIELTPHRKSSKEVVSDIATLCVGSVKLCKSFILNIAIDFHIK